MTEPLTSWLRRMVAAGASDAHLDLGPPVGRLRWRVDGELRPVATLPPDEAQALVAASAQATGLAVAQRPDEQYQVVTIEDQPCTLRAAWLPGLAGGRLALALLPAAGSLVPWEELGWLPDEERAVDRLLAADAGLLVVAGPEASGKSTVLYRLFDRAATPDRNAIALAEPGDPLLDGVATVALAPERGLTAPVLIQAAMAHAPDLLLAGELTGESLEACLQSALSGRLVVASLTAGDGLAALARLAAMGADPALLALVLRGVVAVRLVRRICAACAADAGKSPGFAADWLGIPANSYLPRSGQGCPACGGTGFRGRQALFEVVEVNPALADAIAGQAPPDVIRDLAFATGLPTFGEHAAELVTAGVTTAEEAVRALGLR